MKPAPFIKTSRIEALNDGVFAIVMTLIIFDLKFPEIADTSKVFGLFYQTVVPKILVYVLTFVILGTLWVGSHYQHHFTERTDRVLIWLSLIYLMIVCLIPFTARFLSEFPHLHFAIILYSVNMALTGILQWVMWDYTDRNDFTENWVPKRTVKAFFRQIVLAPTFYLLAIPAVYLNIYLAYFCLCFPPIYYLLPGRIDGKIENKPLTKDNIEAEKSDKNAN